MIKNLINGIYNNIFRWFVKSSYLPWYLLRLSMPKHAILFLTVLIVLTPQSATNVIRPFSSTMMHVLHVLITAKTVLMLHLVRLANQPTFSMVLIVHLALLWTQIVLIVKMQIHVLLALKDSILLMLLARNALMAVRPVLMLKIVHLVKPSIISM